MFYDIENDTKFNSRAMDLYKEIEAVPFRKTIVKLTFILTQGFQISDISLQKDTVIKRSDQKRLKYQLHAFHCEPRSTVFNNEVGSTPFVYNASSTYSEGYSFSNNRYVETAMRNITQSTIVYIFLKLTGNSVNISIRKIVQLQFIQPISNYTIFYL